jgi:hypothetical protein
MPSREWQIGPLRIRVTVHGFVPRDEMLIMLRNYPLAFYHAGRDWLKAFAKLDRAGDGPRAP